MQDKSYNVFSSQSKDRIVCDADWERKLRKIIDDGENDIDKIWQKMCQWYVAHKSQWNPDDSFINIVDAMYGLFGKLYGDLVPEDQKRWRQVKGAFGNVRFGGRGEINYPSFDKLQHFLGGAYIGNRYLANVVGTAVEVKDAFTRWWKDYITKTRKHHHVGYDIHDLEWTWAGGGFVSAVDKQSLEGISKILIKFANAEIIFSNIYSSIMPNKDPSPEYEDNPNIDHAEWCFPNIIQYPVKASLINSQIKKMENLIHESAK